MPLETATYINQLVDTNPVDTDSEGQGGAHLRLVKSTLQATFPNVAGTVTATQAQLSATVREAPLGSVQFFPADPGTTLMARGGTATGTEKYIECDGGTYVSATFSALSASGMVTISGSNFIVPQLKNTGRFLRSRTSGVAAGTSQSNQNAAHTHTITDPGHTHTATDSGHGHAGSTASSSVIDAGHTHAPPSGGSFQVELTGPSSGVTGGANGYDAATTGSNTTGISVTTSVSVATGVANVTNATNTTGITAASQGGSEARPEAYVGVYAIVV